MKLPNRLGTFLAAVFNFWMISSAHGSDIPGLPTVRVPSLDPSQIKYICDDNGCVAQNYLELKRCLYTAPDGKNFRIPTIDELRACIELWQTNYTAQCVTPVDDPASPGAAKSSGMLQLGVAKTLGGFCIDGGCKGVAEIKFWECIGSIYGPGITSTSDPAYQLAAYKCAERREQDLELCPTTAKPGGDPGDDPGLSKPFTSVEPGTAK